MDSIFKGPSVHWALGKQWATLQMSLIITALCDKRMWLRVPWRAPEGGPIPKGSVCIKHKTNKQETKYTSHNYYLIQWFPTHFIYPSISNIGCSSPPEDMFSIQTTMKNRIWWPPEIIWQSLSGSQHQGWKPRTLSMIFSSMCKNITHCCKLWDLL